MSESSTASNAWPAPAHMEGAERKVHHSALEREVKLAVEDLGPVERRLRALGEGAGTNEGEAARGAGAYYLGLTRESNEVLDTAREELKARDERLRVRTIEGRPGVRVTWKGPASVRGGVRRREEREFHADDRAACVAVLANLGLRPVRSYTKVRDSWRLGPVIVCLDRLPFGAFVEIELTSEVAEADEAGALDRAIAALGLGDAPRVQASYARLQQEWRQTLQKHSGPARKGRR